MRRVEGGGVTPEVALGGDRQGPLADEGGATVGVGSAQGHHAASGLLHGEHVPGHGGRVALTDHSAEGDPAAVSGRGGQGHGLALGDSGALVGQGHVPGELTAPAGQAVGSPEGHFPAPVGRIDVNGVAKVDSGGSNEHGHVGVDEVFAKTHGSAALVVDHHVFFKHVVGLPSIGPVAHRHLSPMLHLRGDLVVVGTHEVHGRPAHAGNDIHAVALGMVVFPGNEEAGADVSQGVGVSVDGAGDADKGSLSGGPGGVLASAGRTGSVSVGVPHASAQHAAEGGAIHGGSNRAGGVAQLDVLGTGSAGVLHQQGPGSHHGPAVDGVAGTAADSGSVTVGSGEAHGPSSTHHHAPVSGHGVFKTQHVPNGGSQHRVAVEGHRPGQRTAASARTDARTPASNDAAHHHVVAQHGGVLKVQRGMVGTRTLSAHPKGHRPAPKARPAFEHKAAFDHFRAPDLRTVVGSGQGLHRSGSVDSQHPTPSNTPGIHRVLRTVGSHTQGRPTKHHRSVGRRRPTAGQRTDDLVLSVGVQDP